MSLNIWNIIIGLIFARFLLISFVKKTFKNDLQNIHGKFVEKSQCQRKELHGVKQSLKHQKSEILSEMEVLKIVMVENKKNYPSMA